MNLSEIAAAIRDPNGVRYLSLFGSAVARCAVVTLLLISLVMGMHAIQVTDPATASELASAFHMGTVAGYTVTVFDPVVLAAVTWSMAPIGRVLWTLLTALENHGGETA